MNDATAAIRAYFRACRAVCDADRTVDAAIRDLRSSPSDLAAARDALAAALAERADARTTVEAVSPGYVDRRTEHLLCDWREEPRDG